MRRGLVVAAGTILLLSGCAGEPRTVVPTSPSAVPLETVPPAGPVSTSVAAPEAGSSWAPRRPGSIAVTVVGDSLTAGTSADFAHGRVDPDTWTAQLAGPRIALVGGWAVPGATTADMRAGVRPVSADLLVVMAGTNDVSAHVAAPEIEENLLAVVRTVGAHRVLVSAIPPDRWAPEDAVAYNADLKAFAAAHGWRWIDPWGTVRHGSAWARGASVDGVHPAPAVAKVVGDEIAGAVQRG